jgi:ankyrin repeat protein
MPDVKRKDGDSSLQSRLEPNSKADTVRLLAIHGADVTAQDQTGSTPLHIASSWGCTEIVQLLIELGADINAQCTTQLTPLHTASAFVSTTITSPLIYLMTHLNGQKCGDFRRHVKRSIAHTETVRLLIKHGADVTAQDEACSTPLHLASSHGSADTVRLLIEHGADVTAKDGDHRTPLHLVSSPVRATTTSFLTQHRLMLRTG